MRRKKSKLLSILLVFVLLIGLGYAFLTQDLTILGTSKVRGNTWDIHFENLQVNSNSVTLSSGDVAASIDNNDNTLANYTVTLNKPGDFYEFTVDVVNKGTVDGMVDLVVSKMNNQVIDNLPSYLTYTVEYKNGMPIEKYHILRVEGKETYRVRIEFKKDVTAEELPDSLVENEFSFSVTFVQATDDAIPVPPPYFECTYEGEIENGTRYENGQYYYIYSTYSEGWHAYIVDKDSTDPVTTKLCTVINDIPVNDLSWMFAGSKTSFIDTSSFNTSNIKDMSGMFQLASNLRTIDFSSFDTSNVENMYMMFTLSGFNQLDLSTFDTSKVTNMSYMFEMMDNLKSVNLSSFDTSNVENMDSMFYGASSLTTIDLSNFNVSKAYNNNNFGYILAGTSSLQKAILDGWDLSESNLIVSNSVKGGFFFKDSSIKEISCKNWKLPENFSSWINTWDGVTIEKLDLTGWDLSKTKNLASLFERGYKIKTIIGFDTWDTSNVEDIHQMFCQNNVLEEVDLSHFNVSKVTSMASMFHGCYNLKRVNFDNWDLSNSSKNVIYTLFTQSQLDSLSLKNWKLPEDFSNSLTMSYMFAIDGYTKTIDVTGWDLSKTKNLSNLFYNHSNLETIIGLETWNTSNVENMSSMFEGTSSLTSLNLSSFNTSNVTNMCEMFYGDTALEELDFSNATFGSVTNSSGMFSGVTSSITLYVKNATARDWIINNGGNSNLTTSNVLIK